MGIWFKKMTSFGNIKELVLPRLSHSSVRFLALVLSALMACNQQESEETVEDQFSMNIRTTEAQSPEQERKSFRLPPGFEIQLFAAEPQIGKPLNMSFDARGRMWVTQSYEYPFADTTGVGKDKITILEDTDGDGRADLVTDFADSLNIPIGILPVKNGVMAYSIPNVYFLEDVDGDDKVDERHVVLSGFEYKDTHGMVNNFFRGLDGWIHASHGFANTSHVTDRNGKTLVMQSGNMFRFRDDGSNLEFTTTGRVNPYGHAYDEMGYLYSTDCHTSPIYQLVRGADYPHFGKKPTGIGFGPVTEIKNQHGATALAGLEYYIATHFPQEYQNSFYYGDVVKSKVYRSTMEKKGTTAYVTQEEDFISTDDPWFRPVDVKMGPDGALYIADFYNRIIGHYEVPLDHPGRDRERGRIWRIVYTGDKPHDNPPVTDWSEVGLDGLIAELGNKNLPLRTTIADQIIDRFGIESVGKLRNTFSQSKDTGQRIQILWLLYRLNALSDQLLIEAFGKGELALKVHVLRVLYESGQISNELMQIARNYLSDPQPDLARAAVMLMARQPHVDQLPLLFAAQENCPEYDTHLKYAIRQCLRDHLRNDEVFGLVFSRQWTLEQQQSLIDVVVGVDSELAARFILSYFQSVANLGAGELITLSSHAARFLTENDLDGLVSAVQTLAGDDLDLQYTVYNALRFGLDRRGMKESGSSSEWGSSLARTFLNKGETSNGWMIEPIEKSVYGKNTWHLVDVEATDEFEATTVLSSGPRSGEGQKSKLYSPDFTIPETLSFQLLGNKRDTDDPDIHTNLVELRLAGSGEVLQQTFITAPEMRKKVVWDISSYKGKTGYLVIVDGSSFTNRTIGIGQLSPKVVELPAESPALIAERQIFAANLAGDYLLTSWNQDLKDLFSSKFSDLHTKAAVADALLSLNTDNLPFLADALNRETTQPFLIESIVRSMGKLDPEKVAPILVKSFSGRPYTVQKEVALTLAQSVVGLNHLLDAVSRQEVAPRVLLERQVNERLMNAATQRQITQYEKLVDGVAKPNEEIQKTIDERLANFQLSGSAISGGSETFKLHCGPCHQMGGTGGSIGPQLDGIGNWGARALTEKILDPNRNISKAFVNYNIKLKDGTSQTGLLRREEGELLVFANAGGQEFSIAKSEIARKKASPFTLMPDHFSKVIPEKDFYLLLNFLLNQK
ncbi:MAG: c-type cytochrome [Cyclobacteriaceae bacterium]